MAPLRAWLPFLRALAGRACLLVSLLFSVERRLLDVAPEALRTGTFWCACGTLVIVFAQQLVRSMTNGATPDTRVAVEAGVFRRGTPRETHWVACSMRGWRENMEDEHVAEELPAPLAGMLLLGVLDGHGGALCSGLAKPLLSKEVLGLAEAGAQADAALERALPRLDARMRSGPLRVADAMPSFLHPLHSCGSTAVVALVDLDRSSLVVANIGDSRAFLIRGGRAQALSEDHKPENPEERKRIVGAGGEVVKCGPCHRVDGNLNLSRAFGDFGLKAAWHLPAQKQKVSAYPDTMRCEFNGGPQELFVLACDGLFEKFTNQNLADFIWPRYKQKTPLEQIGRELLLHCCARRSHEPGTDNETVLLVALPGKATPERADQE